MRRGLSSGRMSAADADPRRHRRGRRRGRRRPSRSWPARGSTAPSASRRGRPQGARRRSRSTSACATTPRRRHLARAVALYDARAAPRRARPDLRPLLLARGAGRRRFAELARRDARAARGLAGRYPRNSLVLLNLGLARFWSGDNRGAVAGAGVDAYEAQPDTPSSLTRRPICCTRTRRPGHARLHAELRALPAIASRLRRSAARRAARAARGAATSTRGSLYGIALQRARPRASRRERAVRIGGAPRARRSRRRRSAAAVAPLRQARSRRARSGGSARSTRRFPHAATVRFHLGLLLALDAGR